MEPRTFVTFNWPGEVPTEQEEDPDAAPPGRSIMEDLRASMAALEHNVGPVEPCGSYGWIMELAAQDRVVSLMLQYSEPWLIILEPRLSWIDRLRGRNAHQQTVSAAMALQSSLRHASATGIQWFTRDDFERNKGRGGAATPYAA